jgi:hypothetical protein
MCHTRPPPINFLEKQTKTEEKKRKKESPFNRAARWACQGFCEKKITDMQYFY